MKRTIQELRANWRQVGSLQDRDGCGDDYDRYRIGIDGVVGIEKTDECFIVLFDNGARNDVYNPNLVVYFS